MFKVTCKYPCPPGGLHTGEHLCCRQCNSAPECEQSCPMHYTECVDINGDNCVIAVETGEEA